MTTICLVLYLIYMHVTNHLLPQCSLLWNQTLEWHCDQIRVCWLICLLFLMCVQTLMYDSVVCEWFCLIAFFSVLLEMVKTVAWLSKNVSFYVFVFLIVMFWSVCVVNKNECGKGTCCDFLLSHLKLSQWWWDDEEITVRILLLILSCILFQHDLIKSCDKMSSGDMLDFLIIN